MGWVREDSCSSKLFWIQFSEVQHQKTHFAKTNTKTLRGKKRRREGEDLSILLMSLSADLHSKERERGFRWSQKASHRLF